MKSMIALVLVSSLFTSIYGTNTHHKNLKAVVVVFRHGHRNIFQTFPTDPYADESYWEGGLGELRNVGKMYHFKLGKWFKRFYKGFLPDIYSRDILRVRSTDVDRTLMSAASHLAGLLEPKGFQVWNRNLNWQPIPIHTVELLTDVILGDVKTCKKYEELYAALEQSAEFRKKWNQTLVDYIALHSGRTITQWFGFIEVYDTLYVEGHDMGYKLPEWTKEVYPQPLERLAALSFAMPCYTPDLARLKLGPFLDEVVTHFHGVVDKQPAHKYKIYSCHDLNIANILQSFGVYDMIRPPYASTIVFELRENTTTKKHFVNVLYKNETDIEAAPHRITIKGCQFDCDLDKFTKVLAPITVNLTQWKRECDVQPALNVNTLQAFGTGVREERQSRIVTP